MYRTALFLSILFLFVCAPGCETTPSLPEPGPVVERRTDAGHLSVDRQHRDFGLVDKGQELKTSFVLKNDGKETLTIGDIIPSCKCVLAPLATKVLEPNQSVALDVSFKAPSDPGSKSVQTIRVHTEPPALPSALVLRMKAEVKRYVTVEPQQFELLLNRKPAEAVSLKVSSVDGRPFRILDAQIPDKAIQLDYDKTRSAKTHIIPVHVDRDTLNRSRSIGKIVLRLDHPELQRVSVGFKVIRPYTAVPSYKRFSGARPGKTLSGTLSIVSAFKEPFELGEIQSENGYVKVVDIQAAPYEYTLKLEMAIPKNENRRMLTDNLRIQIKGEPKDSLKVFCYAAP